jgi:ABC-type transport system involved in multi-copper enzyme maturation permease subunit
MNPGPSLSSLLGRSVSSAVLLREAARTSRRWQTYAARAGFSGVLLTVLLLGIWGAVSATRSSMVDVSSLASLGRGLFVAFSVVQTLLALVLAPLVTAAAITEETDERTLEMLVLTRLRPEQILTAKILSRILVLVTVVCGALPVMALVVNLGGVSAVEVVAVTVHTLTTVVLMSVFGAFFSLFTRSPTLATAASVSYVVPFFLIYPAIYALATGNPLAAAHFSTFAASVATDWSALLPPLSYLPAVGLTLRLSAPLFQQKVSSASITRAFSEDVWHSRRWGLWLAVWFGLGTLTLPWMAPLSYALRGSAGVAGWAWYGVAAALWAYFTAGAALGTWAFLRVGMDVVDGIDALLGGSSPLSVHRERASQPVSDHPILWREVRLRAWSATALPMLMVWGFLLLIVFQTGWWIVPGGLLAVGALNAALAIAFASWLATRSIAEERRRGTFELLLCTTLPARSIVVGKLLAAVLPTAPMMLLAGVMLTLGVPQLRMFTGGDDALRGLFVGLLAFLWTVPLWLLAVVASMVVALRASRPQAAFGLVMVGLSLVLGLPVALGHLFPGTAVAVAASVLAPPLFPGTHPLVTLLSGSALALVAAALGGWSTEQLRRWAGAWVAIVALGLALGPRDAEAAPSAEEIEQLERLFRLRMEARPLADGVAREGLPTTVRVRLENGGVDTSGTLTYVQPTFDGGSPRTWVRPVELAAGARKEVLLDLVPGGGGDQVLTFVGDDGRRAVAVVSFQVASGDDVGIAVIGRDALGLPALLRDATSGPVPARAYRGRSQGDRAVRVGLVAPEALPQHGTAWGAVDWIVWPDADPTRCSEAQLDALRAFVVEGGHLLITVSDTWRQLRDSSLAPALPVVLDGLSEQVVPRFWSPGDPPAGQVPVARAAAVPGAWVRAAASETPLFVGRPYGAGTVHVLLADLDAPPFADLRADDRGWRRILTLPGPEGIATDVLASETAAWAELARAYHLEPVPTYRYANQGEDLDRAWEASLRDRLDDIPGVAPLPLEWLVAFAVAYLFAIGPLDFLALRFLRRQPWTWVTFPVWIATFSAGALYLVATTKGSQAVMVRIELLDLFPDAALARGTTFLGLFSTGKTRVTLESGLPDARILPMQVAGFQEDVRVGSGDGPGALSWHAETWTLGYARSDWTRPETGGVRLEGGELVSDLPFDLASAVLVVPADGADEVGGLIALGPVRRGARVPVPDAMRPAGARTGDDRLDWVLDHFTGTVPGPRGTMDLEHRAALVGVAETATEPLTIGGLRPEERAFTVVRQSLPFAARMPADALQATIRFDPARLDLAAELACTEGAAPPVTTLPGALRMRARPDCSVSVHDLRTGATAWLSALQVGATFECGLDPQNPYALLCQERATEEASR